MAAIFRYKTGSGPDGWLSYSRAESASDGDGVVCGYSSAERCLHSARSATVRRSLFSWLSLRLMVSAHWRQSTEERCKMSAARQEVMVLQAGQATGYSVA
ncbi:MAG: hypothetical protein CMI02_02755 [Oceanospirillaceae bacterium]|nr:hypothetical protein [Oceanospirillaceae bacterium]MBT10940.1 hypothetical protein [Oceanospirillaceae bacterium]|tara:strand:+ start:10417 stop:10716 length:300 start_codon:yes stop_codon:yes gene_type:complete